MSPIGSVFLGDVQRHRVLSSSTPPSSPGPPISPLSSAPASFPRDDQVPIRKDQAPVIDPMLSLQLRLRWLEALLYGVRPPVAKDTTKGKYLQKGETLLRTARQIQLRLDALVENNDSLRKFIEHCTFIYPMLLQPDSSREGVIDDQHSHLLTPTFALSGILPTSPPSYENMSASELETFLSEMEPEIRAADRDMREIEMLEKKGIASAGKLTGE
jgi:hypothetical protein